MYLGSDATTSRTLCSLRLSGFGKGQKPRKKYIVIDPTLGVPGAPDDDAESMVDCEYRTEYLKSLRLHFQRRCWMTETVETACTSGLNSTAT